MKNFTFYFQHVTPATYYTIETDKTLLELQMVIAFSQYFAESMYDTENDVTVVDEYLLMLILEKLNHGTIIEASENKPKGDVYCVLDCREMFFLRAHCHHDPAEYAQRFEPVIFDMLESHQHLWYLC